MLASTGKTKVGLLLIILALVVVVLGLTWVVVSIESNQSATTAAGTSVSSTPIPTPTATVTPVAAIRTQRTTLTDPSGQNVLGEMVKESASADDNHYKVTVKLPAPSGADSYAVWLKQTEGTDTKYLGKLNQSGEDYILEYQSGEDVQNFDKIVVTSGPAADTKIETIVAEGTVASQLLL